jgi:hypothetical protein
MNDNVEWLREQINDARNARREEQAAEIERLRAKVAALEAEKWQPGPDVWAQAPEWAKWVTGDYASWLMFHEDEPEFNTNRQWYSDGRKQTSRMLPTLPLGVDYRLAKWQRP